MPNYAYIGEHVPCPKCHTNLACHDRIGFQWGYCASSSTVSYRIGDHLIWRADAGGKVPAWVYFTDGSCNIGDPAVTHVLIRESEFEINRCVGCGLSFAGIGVVIRSSVIESVQAFSDLETDVDVFVFTAEGLLKPCPEWNDPPMVGGVIPAPAPSSVA